jgi:lysophospholipase L1-like esterase
LSIVSRYTVDRYEGQHILADRSSSSMRNLALIALLIFLPTFSNAEESSGPTAAAAATSALVSNPCPAPPPMPQAMADGPEQLLKPGKLDGSFQRSFGEPDVQEFLKAVQEQARTDWPNLCRYRAANAALSQPTRAVFMGDSITELWVKADPELFSNGVIGRGISGQTSPQMLLRFFQDVVELHPQTVHIMAGTNDLAGNTGPSTPQGFKNNIMAMVELAHAHQIRVVLASIPPASAFSFKPTLRPAQDIVALNRWLRDYAKASHSDYVDYYAVLTDAQGGFLSALSNDGVHPNRDGYMRMHPLALKALAKRTQ